MKRPHRSLLLLLLACACSEDVPAPVETLDAPNVVVIVVDTLRADRLAFYGCEQENAPFLSELAAESVVFENAWAASSWTAPSTASIFTGLYPDRHGVQKGYFHYKNMQRVHDAQLNRIPPQLATLPRVFQQRGYRTFGIADNPNVCERMGFSAGFERFQTYDYEGAPRVNATLEEWLPELRASAQPWLLYLHYMDPHEPYHARDPWYDHERATPEPSLQNDFLAYDSEISYLDAHLRELFERIDLRQEAIVVFTSDHGEEFGEHGGSGHPNKLYNELVSIPLFIRMPGAPQPARVSGAVSHVDLLPTLVELSGAQPLDLSDGVSLASHLDAESRGPAPRPLYMTRSGMADLVPIDRSAIVQGSFKGILTRWGILTRPNEVRSEFQLFDLRGDPGEELDASEERPRVAGALRDLLLEYLKRPRPVPRSFFELGETSDEQAAMLDRLGYGGGDEEDE